MFGNSENRWIWPTISNRFDFSLSHIVHVNYDICDRLSVVYTKRFSPPDDHRFINRWSSVAISWNCGWV